MTRTAALESATRLAAASGNAYRVYNINRGWKVMDGILMDDEAFYRVRPDGRITFHLCRASKGKEIRPAR